MAVYPSPWIMLSRMFRLFCVTGLHEAVYQGVPVLGVPLFRDQPTNVKKLEVRSLS